MGKDVSNEVVDLSGLEEAEIPLVTNDATIKHIRKAKAEIVENVQAGIIEDLEVAATEELQQNKAENISKWSDRILGFLEETERNRVLELACNLQINPNARLHKTLGRKGKIFTGQYQKICELLSVYLVQQFVCQMEWAILHEHER